MSLDYRILFLEVFLFSLSGCFSTSPLLSLAYAARSSKSIKEDFKTATILPFVPETQLICAAVDASMSRVNWSSVCLHSVTFVTCFTRALIARKLLEFVLQAGSLVIPPSTYFYMVPTFASLLSSVHSPKSVTLYIYFNSIHCRNYSEKK